MSLLPERSRLETLAENQLHYILNPTRDRLETMAKGESVALSAKEWSRLAMIWRCIKAGLFVPCRDVECRRLQHRNVRDECEKLFDRFTLDDAADITGAKGGKDASETT